MAHQSHPPWCYRPNIRKKYKLWRSSLPSFLQRPVTSSHLGPNIIHSNAFSHTQSGPLISDEVSHPSKQQAKL
jgi:hypothetical protein